MYHHRAFSTVVGRLEICTILFICASSAVISAVTYHKNKNKLQGSGYICWSCTVLSRKARSKQAKVAMTRKKGTWRRILHLRTWRVPRVARKALLVYYVVYGDMVNGRQRLAAKRDQTGQGRQAGKQKRPAMAALPSMSGCAGPKQGAKTRRKWPLREVPVGTCSGYATHLSLGGHVVLLAPDTVLYLDAEPALGSRQSSEQGAERSPAQTNSLCSSPLTLLAHFPATCFIPF